jgi:hypothetical protein
MSKWIVTLIFSVLAILITGCSHPMTVTNLDQYRKTTNISLDHRLKLGVSAKAADVNGHRLIHDIGRDLLKYNVESTTLAKGEEAVDVLATISVAAKNRGSGWNFWADFPGFIVWYPTLNGYDYHVMYDIDVSLNDAVSGELINSFFLPVRLKVKHADISRTWVDGVAWPTLGLSALIGGLPHMRYDEDVSPLVELEAAPVLADYVAQQIAIDLRYYWSEPRARLERLKLLLKEGIITQDEFDEKRREISEDI